jgi:NADPH-dependent glutamate synthase beta subunit-like oxidoreductase
VVKKEKVAVIGAGPAGLSCAYYLAGKGYGVKVWEAMPDPGGMLRYGIPAYRLPRRILNEEIARIESLGVKIETGKKLGEDFAFEDLKSYAAVFLATGAWAENKPKISGDDLKGVWHGLAFLREINLGKRIPLGRKVIVIGGGNTAIDSARVAWRLGSQVTVLYRRAKEDMPAILSEVEEAEREGVKFIFNAAPVGFSGKSGKIQKVEWVRTKPGKPDASGRRSPLPIRGSNSCLQADSVICAVGERADLSCLKDKLTTGNGLIAIDSWGRTNMPGIFAGGDAATGEGYVSSAIASGKKGALAIERFLRGENFEPTENEQKIARFSDINLDYFSPSNRVQISSIPPGGRKRGFKEVHKGLSKAKAHLEAGRCFSCGNCIQCNVCLMVCPDVAISFAENENRYVIDLDHCKGCGICSVECPRSAMTLEEEKWNE